MSYINHLRTFLEVYHQQSFSKAAVQIGITQPAVSQQIQSLESFIGKPLFVRLARGVADELANSVAASLDTLEQKLSGFRSGAVSGGVVHLAAPADFVHYQMVKVLQGLLSDGFPSACKRATVASFISYWKTAKLILRLRQASPMSSITLMKRCLRKSHCWCMPPHLPIKSAKRRIKSGCRNCLLSVSTRNYRV